MSTALIVDASNRISIRIHPPATVAGTGQAVGFDPISLITILLPILIKCFQKEDEPDPAQVKATVEWHCKREGRKRRFRNRIADQAEETAWDDQGVKLSRPEALKVADGVIAEALETSEETMTAVCTFVYASAA